MLLTMDEYTFEASYMEMPDQQAVKLGHHPKLGIKLKLNSRLKGNPFLTHVYVKRAIQSYKNVDYWAKLGKLFITVGFDSSFILPLQRRPEKKETTNIFAPAYIPQELRQRPGRVNQRERSGEAEPYRIIG